MCRSKSLSKNIGLTRISVILLAFAGIFLIEGCNTYRMMPSHGGGKRFDEEQRAVASAARKAIADMNVQELEGHKINITIESVAQNGGGTVQLPGVTNVSGGYNNLNSDTENGQPVVASQQKGWNFNAIYNANTLAYPTVFTTDQDLRYLDTCLQMKLRHQQIITPDPNAEYMLFVLVDVFGTNRSKQDSIIAWTDTLSAACELTYYAIDLKTKKLLFRARRSSAEATYAEQSIFGLAAYHIDRQLYRIEPSPMPIDSSDSDEYPIRVTVKGTPSISNLLPGQSTVADQKASSPSPKSSEFDQKLQEADSYIQSGNLAAAQRIITEIMTQSPRYPGLDAVNARLEQAKAAAVQIKREPPVK